MIWTRTDARKHDIGAIDAMYVVYFINIKQTHYLIGWKKFNNDVNFHYILTYIQSAVRQKIFEIFNI